MARVRGGVIGDTGPSDGGKTSKGRCACVLADGHVELLGPGDRRDLFYRDKPNRVGDGWW